MTDLAAIALPLRTWTVTPDYGGSPVVWERDGRAEGLFLGECKIHAHDSHDLFPTELADALNAWSECFARQVLFSSMDWESFHREGLRLSAEIAVWVAELNVIVRYMPASEDLRFRGMELAYIWMDSYNAAQCIERHVDDEDMKSLERLFFPT